MKNINNNLMLLNNVKQIKAKQISFYMLLNSVSCVIIRKLFSTYFHKFFTITYEYNLSLFISCFQLFHRLSTLACENNL